MNRISPDFSGRNSLNPSADFSDEEAPRLRTSLTEVIGKPSRERSAKELMKIVTDPNVTESAWLSAWQQLCSLQNIDDVLDSEKQERKSARNVIIFLITAGLLVCAYGLYSFFRDLDLSLPSDMEKPSELSMFCSTRDR